MERPKTADLKNPMEGKNAIGNRLPTDRPLKIKSIGVDYAINTNSLKASQSH